MLSEIQDQIDGAAEEADLLQQYANYLDDAAKTQDDNYKLLVLDDNLQMWVSIEASAKSQHNDMPQNIKDNLCKLSKYVEQVTLSKGVNMTENYFHSLAEINRQISQGLMESVNANLAQQEAYYLAKTGLDMIQARSKKDNTALVEAMDCNQQLWVMIKTLMKSGKTKLPQETRDNLIKLADYVAGNTIKLGQNLDNLDDKLLNSLVSINRNIAEGLIGHR
ncbi:MAG: hypothetical protein IJ184_01205 [Alphaproteobacteria bacterium]|nr:hypothetical protein [Alphaproteobacteria bacterium]